MIRNRRFVSLHVSAGVLLLSILEVSAALLLACGGLAAVLYPSAVPTAFASSMCSRAAGMAGEHKAVAWAPYSKETAPAFIDECFAALSAFDYGKDLLPLRKLSAYVESLEADSPHAKDLEARFVAVLESESSVAARKFACRQLALVGADASLPVLENLLTEEAMAESALYALEQIPGPGRVLRAGLGKSSGAARTPIINALGRRRDGEAVVLLRPMAVDQTPGVRQAAIQALGLIGTPEAASALREAKPSIHREDRRLLALSLLACGERLASSGHQQQAVSVFRELSRPDEDAQLLLGALKALSLVDGPRVVPDLISMVKTGDSKAAANAIQVLLQVPGSAPVEGLADVLPALSPATQQAAILALGERRHAGTAVSSVVNASRSGSAEVRAAAWTALGRCGDASHIPQLVNALLAKSPAERTAARLSLAGMNCPGFDSALLGLLQKAETDAKIEIAGVIEERRMASAADSLVAIVRENHGKLRGAALKALRKAASEGQIRPLIDLLASSSDPGDNALLGETVSSLLKNYPQGHISYLYQSYRTAAHAPRQARLISGLRGVGNPEALSLLKEAMANGGPEVQRMAVLGLADWPDSAPTAVLLSFAAQTTADAPLRALALRGTLRLIALPAGRSDAESVALIRQVFDLAPGVEEQKAALAVLDRFPCPDAVRFGEAALSNPSLSAEAKSALERLRAAAAGEARLLVYTRNYVSGGQGYVHDNIASSVEAIRKLGGENGFSIDVSDQPSVFTEENLKQYKAIVFSNSNDEAFENDDQREVFRRYIRRGGGFVGVHSACASEHGWPWFWTLVGGTFDFHPPLQPFTIRVVDKNHASTAFFEKDTWQWEDEFYFLKERKDKVQVLLAGDVKSLKNRGAHPERLSGQPDPCPLVWCHHFEGGRAWYTALGHKKEHYQDPVYLKHLLGGILWVIGEQATAGSGK